MSGTYYECTLVLQCRQKSHILLLSPNHVRLWNFSELQHMNSLQLCVCLYIHCKVSLGYGLRSGHWWVGDGIERKMNPQGPPIHLYMACFSLLALQEVVEELGPRAQRNDKTLCQLEQRTELDHRLF